MALSGSKSVLPARQNSAAHAGRHQDAKFSEALVAPGDAQE
jgi:hypothetical protein